MDEIYSNFRELHLDIAEKRISKGEDPSTKLQANPPAQSSTYASFYWKEQIYNVKGDTKLVAMQEAFNRYQKYGDEAFIVYENPPETLLALNCNPRIRNLYIYSK